MVGVLQLQDAIAILQLTRYRTPEDLKAAFRALAHRYHPDKNPGRDTTGLFREVMHAYQLCLEHLDELARHFSAPPPPPGFDAAAVIATTGDIFADMFGISDTTAGGLPGQGRLFGFRPAESVTLPLAIFARGGEKLLRVTAYQPCPRCRSSGALPDAKSRLCRQCFGFGSSLRLVGGGETRQLCQACQGRGREIDRPCGDCDGHGVRPRRGKYRIRFPAALSPRGRYTLPVSNLSGHPSGHIVVTPKPARDKIFQIENCDLVCEYYTDFPLAGADSKLMLATPFGEITVAVESNAGEGAVIRVPQAGLAADAGDKRGDLVVTLRRLRPPLWRSLLARIFPRHRGG